MPELPEVETVRRGLAPVLEGARILRVEQRRPDLRFPFPERFAARLEGRRVVGLDRRAKYLLARLDDGQVLLMHLGMTGRFRIERPGVSDAPGDFYHDRPPDPRHDHVVFQLEGDAPGEGCEPCVGGVRIVYNDARRFGFMVLADQSGLDSHPLLRHLGIEPLSPALDGARLIAAFRGRSTSLKAALMDQRLVAGLGNIYVCEALWRARLSPLRSAGTIATRTGGGARTEALAHAIRAVLEEAVAAGGSTLRDYRQADGRTGGFQERFAVYDRADEPCFHGRCRGTIRRIAQNGRSTFYCPECQR